MSERDQSDRLENFEKAFSTCSGGCRRQCACGREFYNPDGLWSWDDGELEKLEANKGATALEWTVSTLSFEGTEYVMDCDCWRERATKLMAFIDGHAWKIAEWLSLEKERKQRLANASPVVRSTPTPETP